MGNPAACHVGVALFPTRTVLTNPESIMKLTSLAALLISAAVAVPAFAGDDIANPVTNGPKTRAEVKAELAQARAGGELGMNPNAPAYPQRFAMGGYTVPREQINTVHASAQSNASLSGTAVQN